jgi:mono/diheme cytochrome c family protein
VLLAGLPTSHKIGLGLVALAFVAFALGSSFLVPRYRRDFPGKAGVGGFVALCLLFFCSMIAAVWFFGKEPKEVEAKGETPAATSTATVPAPTTTAAAAPTTTEAKTTTAAAPPPAPKGDPAAGEQLFTANGCGSCHTFAPASSVGTVGPDLDKLAADAQKAGKPLDQYTAESIENPGAYVVPGYPDGVMPSFASLGDAKIQDLVAFLTSKS